MAARNHARTKTVVESTARELSELEPEYPTLAEAIKALVPTIKQKINEGHRVGKVYEFVAEKLHTKPTTVKSVIQRLEHTKQNED